MGKSTCVYACVCRFFYAHKCKRSLTWLPSVTMVIVNVLSGDVQPEDAIRLHQWRKRVVTNTEVSQIRSTNRGCKGVKGWTLEAYKLSASKQIINRKPTIHTHHDEHWYIHPETSTVRLTAHKKNKCMLVLWYHGCQEVLKYQRLSLSMTNSLPVCLDADDPFKHWTARLFV